MDEIGFTEVWMPVKGYEGKYIVNRNGIIKSLYKRNLNQPMPQRIDRAGYWTVRLSKENHDSTRYVHRIIAESFIVNPNNKCCVNHINGNKLDNTFENLEWVTQAENMQHAYKTGLIINMGKKEIKVINICTNETYQSIKKASMVLNLKYSSLKNMLNGKRTNKTCLRIAA